MEIQEFLKKEHYRYERIQGMKVLNMVREFKMLKMKEFDTIKEYWDKLISLSTKLKLLGVELLDTKIG